ncbi:hypothetical protein GCM10020000_66220 [Streptomyces olivoverticillatus]
MPCWFDGPLAAFDTETTGVDVEHDRIVSAALVTQSQEGALPVVTRWLVNPGGAGARGGDGDTRPYGRPSAAARPVARRR